MHIPDMTPRVTRGMRRASLMLVALPLLASCTSAEEKARREEEAMVALAKADAEAESLFVHDSLAVAASISLDTVNMLVRTTPLYDDDGNVVTPAQLIVRSTRGADCLIDSARAVRVVQGDTLRCQWTHPDSQP